MSTRENIRLIARAPLARFTPLREQDLLKDMDLVLPCTC